MKIEPQYNFDINSRGWELVRPYLKQQSHPSIFVAMTCTLVITLLSLSKHPHSMAKSPWTIANLGAMFSYNH